ncbi:hypothetical protein RKD23_007765 [Streptomyces sp. SAI-170]|uniref:hypothetical protein n=1 Tax=Streptomyces sp. SAI-170 TaxID=3377729 RepID=UPI003C79C9A4
MLVEEGGRGVPGEPAEREPRQVPSRRPGFADGGEQGDGAALEPAGGEEQHTGGGRVEPSSATSSSGVRAAARSNRASTAVRTIRSAAGAVDRPNALRSAAT